MRKSRVFNIKNPVYGAAGNGIADDGQEIQAAITAANAAGGGDVILPGGTYRTTVTINMWDNVHLKGVGRGDVTIILDSASEGELFDFTGVSDASIENLTIDGNKDVTPSEEGFIDLTNATRCKLLNLEIYDAPGAGAGSIFIDGTASEVVVDSGYYRVGESTAIGISGADLHGYRVSNIEIRDYTGFGVRIGENAYGNLIEHVKTYSNDLELVGIANGAHSNTIESCYASGSDDNGFSISGAGRYNKINNSTARYNQKAGIHVWGLSPR
jgi:Pectate lyase superfamily protein